MHKATILSKIKPHSDVVDFFKSWTFKKHWSISWNSFLWAISVIKTDQAFKGYAMSHKVEIIEKKIQLYNRSK